MIRTILMSGCISALRAPASAVILVGPMLLGVTACDRAAPATDIVGPVAQAPHFASSPNWGAWSEPVNLLTVNSTGVEKQPVLSPDGLSLYISSNRAGGLGGTDLWVSQRSSRESPWQVPVNLGAPVNTASDDDSPALSRDGLLLFYHSNRPGGEGNVDIYVSRRAREDDAFGWGPAINLGTDVNTSDFDAGPMFMPQVEDGPTNLYFGRGPTAGEVNTYSVAIRRDGTTLGPASPVSEIDFAGAGITNSHATVSKDGKEVIFFSTRPGGFGLADLYVSTRQSVHFAWSAPMNLGPPLSTAFADTQPSLSFDGGTLLFASNRPGGVGGNDVWLSTRERM